MMEHMKEISVIKHNSDPAEATIEWGQKGEAKLVLGEFIDIEKPEFTDKLRALIKRFK